MSPSGERTALHRPVSLYEHATRLRRRYGDQPIPHSDRLPSDAGRHASPRTSISGNVTDLASVIREFLDHPDQSAGDLNDRCRALEIRPIAVERAVRALAVNPDRRLVDAARWLVRHSTDSRAVLVGLHLLAGTADATDIPLITSIGLLPFADNPAIRVLASIPGASSELMWLAERSRQHARIAAVQVLAGNPDPGVRDWILGTPRELLAADLARRIAEAYDLAGMVEQATIPDHVWDAAGNLLVAMTGAGHCRFEIDRYASAAAAYGHWVRHGDGRTPTLDRAALLTMICADVATGPGALAIGPQGTDLVDDIRRTLASGRWRELVERCAASPDPVEARRAAWMIDSVARIPASRDGFHIYVAVPDPVPAGYVAVETRILVNGVPVIAAAFDKGPPAQPEHLVEAGRLTATDTPHEVRLAEAYCTEGCCGALYVTIARDGTDVVWSNWRGANRAESPDVTRFNATQYDAEVARAERDHGWEWPARTVARLLRAKLQADPTILGRWGCRLDWCSAWPNVADTTLLTFGYPISGPPDGPHAQFGLVIDVNTACPEDVVSAVVDRLQTTDPKSYAEIIGGTPDGAARLGLAYTAPTRWKRRA